MTPREQRLQAYIAAVRGEPVIGLDDCGPWVLRWVAQETARKIAFPAYTTRAQGYALARRAGGLSLLAAPLLAAAGLYETPSPRYGDPVVLALTDRDTAGILCHGGVVAVRGERAGVAFLALRRLVKAWALPDGD